ncbi:ShlB/FhaC/HecB family hemolysin secretion/activation protein [Serratia sp. NPDC078593]|uniref:ShlB/FhaC/HecB family hemolysin secretion/activation protein n=1 Tax=unclassified Serratia (in: enterobacteria) TaxID=2647522 RepID=UPI0037CF0A9A
MHRRISLTLLFIALPLQAAVTDSSQRLDQQVTHQQEQEKARYQQLAPAGKEVRATSGAADGNTVIFPEEEACLPIQQVVLDNTGRLPRKLKLNALAIQGEGRCLGINGIKALVTALQNRLIDQGYITTRVLTPRQDLRSGTLTLTIVPGTVGKLALTPDSNSRVSLDSAFPVARGEILDLRAIEQGLENLQRIPGVSATIQLVPGAHDGETDVLIDRQMPSFWRVGGWLDDSGSKFSGRYQTGVALYLDNPAALNDQFYISLGRNLHAKNSHHAKNASIYYSVPYGYWSLDLYAGKNETLQSIPGTWSDFHYLGKTRTMSARLNRILSRGAKQKTTFNVQLLKRDSHYYLNETEILIQERDTTTVMLGLNHRHYFGDNVLDATLSWQRNVKWLGAESSVAERFGSNDALARAITLDVNAVMPFNLLNQSMSYQARFRQQYSPDRLSTQDKFSMGNRWTVRGFDGEYNLMADRGFYLRNDLNLNLPRWNSQVYLGMDYGQVSGGGSETWSGKRMAGSVIGLRGAKWGLGYDAFVGTPLSKPENFHTSSLNAGFTVQWQF